MNKVRNYIIPVIRPISVDPYQFSDKLKSFLNDSIEYSGMLMFNAFNNIEARNAVMTGLCIDTCDTVEYCTTVNFKYAIIGTGIITADLNPDIDEYFVAVRVEPEASFNPSGKFIVRGMVGNDKNEKGYNELNRIVGLDYILNGR